MKNLIKKIADLIDSSLTIVEISMLKLNERVL